MIAQGYFVGGYLLHRALDKTHAQGWFIGPWNSVVAAL
jgi:hypothetical protein